MKRFARLVPVLFLVWFSSAEARENPFVPVEIKVAKSLGLSEEHSAKASSVTPVMPKAKAEIANYQGIRFLFYPGSVWIETKDTLQKDFSIQKPRAIILDFKSDADFPTRRRDIATLPFKRLKMGIHPGFYRVVLETQGRCAYHIEPYKYGYILTCPPEQ